MGGNSPRNEELPRTVYVLLLVIAGILLAAVLSIGITLLLTMK